MMSTLRSAATNHTTKEGAPGSVFWYLGLGFFSDQSSITIASIQHRPSVDDYDVLSSRPESRVFCGAQRRDRSNHQATTRLSSTLNFQL